MYVAVFMYNRVMYKTFFVTEKCQLFCPKVVLKTFCYKLSSPRAYQHSMDS